MVQFLELSKLESTLSHAKLLLLRRRYFICSTDFDYFKIRVFNQLRMTKRNSKLLGDKKKKQDRKAAAAAKKEKKEEPK